MAEDSKTKVELTEEELAAFGNFDEWDITDLEELPSFDPWANGAHVCTIEFNKLLSGDDKKPAVRLVLTYVSTEQVEESSTTGEDVKLPNPGDTYSYLFQIQNEYGQGALRKILEPLGAATGVTKTTPLMEHVRGFTALVVTKQRYDKKNEMQRMNIVDISLVG